MTRRCGRWLPALTMLAVLGASGSSQAQDLRQDAVANGVLIGAGTGAAAGAVLGLVTEEICSPGDCAYIAAVAGGLIGFVVDRRDRRGDSLEAAGSGKRSSRATISATGPRRLRFTLLADGTARRVFAR